MSSRIEQPRTTFSCLQVNPKVKMKKVISEIARDEYSLEDSIRIDLDGNPIGNFSPHKSDLSRNIKIVMNNDFFASCCTQRCDGTKNLCLQGNDLFSRIGRRLRDSHVPNLLTFLKDNPEVVVLNLAYNYIHCPGFIGIIDHIAIENRIVELNIQSNEIRSRGITHLYDKCDKLCLEVLRLNGNKLSVESNKSIALMLLKNQYIKLLNVAETDQTASSLVYFTTVLRSDQERYNNTLKILDISRPNPGCMHYFDTAHFSSLIGLMLKNNTSLEELYLRKFGFSCHDIELLLMDGKNNKTLLLLDLSCNNIGDFGAELLANWVKERPALSGLILGHNIVTNNGAKALSYGVPFSKLKIFDISYNRISDSGISRILDTIKKSPAIRHLRIFGNCIGHITAKIVDRMLRSGVLMQENLDVKPYRIDHEWFFAQYTPNHYELTRKL